MTRPNSGHLAQICNLSLGESQTGGTWASSNVLGPQVRVWPDFPRVSTNFSEIVSSVLMLNLTNAEDYGTFTCSVWNVSSHSFTLWRAGEGAQGGG